MGDRGNDTNPLGYDGLVFSLWVVETVGLDADVAATLELVTGNDSLPRVEAESWRGNVVALETNLVDGLIGSFINHICEAGLGVRVAVGSTSQSGGDRTGA